MRRRIRIRRPSTGTILGATALFVALGGTALAATGQLVNIADGTNASRIAKVDATGRLLVGDASGAMTVDGAVAAAAPKVPFSSSAAFFNGETTLISGNTATVAINRVTLTNDHRQFGGEGVRLRIVQQGGTGSGCTSTSGHREVLTLHARPGETATDTFPTPAVLKPFSAGAPWCLKALVGVGDGEGTYYLPYVGISGFVVSGTLPAGSVVGGASAPAGATKTADGTYIAK